VDFFIHNLGIFLFAFASLYFAGLGPSLILLPKHQKRESFLLAPLMGICFMTLVGLFQITILLVPFTPRANISVILLSSLLCLILCRHDLQKAWEKFSLTLSWIWILPILLILVFSWMFHNEGLHLLVGGSDQLQYCENAQQILEEMHTGSSLDVPVARQQYFIYEMVTRTQPYLKGYRRGAELFLAATTAITGLSYQAAFPVTVLNALLTLSVTIALIGRFFLRLSRFYTFILQYIFVSSFYFLLLHVQGSLALIIGIPTGLATLAFWSRVNSSSSWRSIVITAIITATYFSIYPEPAFINVLVPTIALLIWRLYKDKSNAFILLRNVSLVYLLVFVLAPLAISTVLAHLIGNFMLLLSPYINVVATPVTHLSAIQRFFPSFAMQTWEVAGAVLGFMSYYNVGSFHHTMKFLFIDHPILALISFMLFSGCGLLGCLKAKNELARLFSIPLVSWLLAAFITAHQQDDYRFTRSLHYMMPFAMVGLVLLVSQYVTHPRIRFNHRKVSWLSVRSIADFFRSEPKNGGTLLSVYRKGSLKALAIVVFYVFIFINIYTTLRTVRFIASHNNGNDPVLLHFEKQNEDWQLLKKELQYSALHQVPVLISGFQETVRPFAISILIREQTHILGASILSFWKVYNLPEHVLKPTPNLKEDKNFTDTKYNSVSTQWANAMLNFIRPYHGMVFNLFCSYGNYFLYKQTSETWSLYNTRLLPSELHSFQYPEKKPWDRIEDDLVNRSEQAVVSINNEYPAEWLTSKDVFPPLVKRFPNICNVVYRHLYAVTLPDSILSSLVSDARGAFRKVSSSGPLIIHDKEMTKRVLTINYDGGIEDIKLRVGDKSYAAKRMGLDDRMTIVATVYPKDKFSMRLDVADDVKIRSIFWDRADG